MRHIITRRVFLKAAAAGLVGAAGAACGAGGKQGRTPGSAGSDEDFSARFARFEVADEPNGDLAKVSWPDYVKRAGPDVQRLYEYQVEHGDLMRYMPCFCGCAREAGHRNNRDCYIKQVNSDGSVQFDNMAPT